MATFVFCLRDCPSCLTARDLTVGSGWCTPRTSVPLEPGRTYTGQQTRMQIVNKPATITRRQLDVSKTSLSVDEVNHLTGRLDAQKGVCNVTDVRLFFSTSRKVFCLYSHLMSGLW